MRSSIELRDDLRGMLDGPRRRALQAELVAALFDELDELVDDEHDETSEERAGIVREVLIGSSAAQVEFHLDVVRHLESTFGSSLAPLEAAAALLELVEPPVRRVVLARQLVRGLARIQDRRASAIAESAIALGDRWLASHPELREVLVALRLSLVADEHATARCDRAREALDIASEGHVHDLIVQAANALADLLLPDDIEGAAAALERARAAAIPGDAPQPSAYALRWLALVNETRRGRGTAELLVEDLFPEFRPSCVGDAFELGGGLELATRFFTPRDGAAEALVSGGLDDVESAIEDWPISGSYASGVVSKCSHPRSDSGASATSS